MRPVKKLKELWVQTQSHIDPRAHGKVLMGVGTRVWLKNGVRNQIETQLGEMCHAPRKET
jgi:hypothetical protein